MANLMEPHSYKFGHSLDLKLYSYLIVNGQIGCSVSSDFETMRRSYQSSQEVKTPCDSVEKNVPTGEEADKEIYGSIVVPSNLNRLRKIARQSIGKFLSHLIPEWCQLLNDKFLAENTKNLHYTIDSTDARLFRIENAQLAKLQTTITKLKDEILIDGLVRELIPEYASSSKHWRNSLIKVFQKKEFCAGVDIIKEGQPN